MAAVSVMMVGCSANTVSTAPTASPMATTAAPTHSPMATAEATAEPSPAATTEAMTPAQAGQLAEKIAQAVQQISEIDEYTKAVEEKEKTDKKLKIKEYYDAKSVILGEYAERLFEKLLNIKWLNKTFSEKNWKIEVQDAINKAESDIKAIKALGSAFEKVLTDKYCETVSLDTVMEYRDELERACEARNDVSAAAPVSVAATATDNTESGSADYTMLKVYASGDALFRLQDYMAMMGIKFEIC